MSVMAEESLKRQSRRRASQYGGSITSHREALNVVWFVVVMQVGTTLPRVLGRTELSLLWQSIATKEIRGLHVGGSRLWMQPSIFRGAKMEHVQYRTGYVTKTDDHCRRLDADYGHFGHQPLELAAGDPTRNNKPPIQCFFAELTRHWMDKAKYFTQ